MTASNPAADSGGVHLISKNSEAVMSLLVVSILVLMILPLPTPLLDLLITFNITFALIVLLVVIYILKPLDLPVFPSMLLVMTLFRLSLNIASTRIILLNGSDGPQAAGKVINAFGNFVVGGNYVVGAIIFVILVLINFMVITKGAGRIAEVAARFTLDAMPGKQMSIDADLNAGFIDEETAKRRRLDITREAEYYGAMDGANKFVKGDAIAGIIITIINILGGLIIGVFQHGMSFPDAARTYTLLAVGDGLVSQIPALIVATAAGIIVTRAGAEASMGEEITVQIFRHPRAIATAAVILLCFGLIPGMPWLPFMILAGLSGTMAYFLLKSEKARSRAEKAAADRGGEPVAPDRASRLLPVDALGLEVGYELIPFVDAEQDGQLLTRIHAIRDQIAREVGVMIPPIHIQDNVQLKPGEYCILLKGNEVARAELMPGHFLAMHMGKSAEGLRGVRGVEPTYGLPAYWIKEEVREDALSKGYTVVDLPTVLVTHLSEIIRRHADELMGRQEVQKMLDQLKETHPTVVSELIPGLLSLGAVGKVLQNLLREQIPIRDLCTILETLADWATLTKDVDILTEYVRQALARTITRLYQSPDGNISLVTLGHDVEKLITDAIQKTDQGSFIALEPNVAQKIITKISRQMQIFSGLSQTPVVLCSAPVRPHLKKLLDRFVPNVAVLSYSELVNTFKIQSLATVELSDAN
ncbi:flagellar biosynthesis protein FlhA [Desulfococcus sp.]|uniref:flagellar biosynthesis protein FlhA n=1 Tax=Desulfococcus sp. TaxID=2025834 RepID=UPI00359451D2